MKKLNLETGILFTFIAIIIGIIAIVIFFTFNSSLNLKNNNNLESPNSNNNETNKAKDIPLQLPKTTTIETQFSTFSTTIFDKDENRIFNINLATSILNNKIIKKGETFSFNKTIGPMGKKDGYKIATGFDTNGKTIKVPAGGMCQISSTIYNTALIANFEIIERHSHSKRVYYVPADKDATVYYDSVDLKFKNTSENDIKIIATTDGHTVTVSFNKIEEKTLPPS